MLVLAVGARIKRSLLGRMARRRCDFLDWRALLFLTLGCCSSSKRNSFGSLVLQGSGVPRERHSLLVLFRKEREADGIADKSGDRAEDDDDEDTNGEVPHKGKDGGADKGDHRDGFVVVVVKDRSELIESQDCVINWTGNWRIVVESWRGVAWKN